jgi:hypothetical protein
MTAHTPEPWTTNPDINRLGWIIESSATGEEVAITRFRPNAARIVACVNACAGINPEAVPDMLAALQDALDTTDFEHGPWRPWHDAARAALAKARQP